MRRSLSAALIALLLLTAPAFAQLFPGGQPAPAERVLIDATIWVNPSVGQELCMTLDPGQVTVTARRVADAVQQRPAELQFYGFRADDEAGLKVAVERQEATGTTRVKGVDHYCWRIVVYAPEVQNPNMTIFERGEYVQTVAVRMTHAAP